MNKKVIGIAKEYIRNFFGSRTGVVTVCALLSLLWFIVEWCMITTFRPLSTWMLWPVNILAALVCVLPYMVTRRVWVQLLVQAALNMLFLSNLMYCRTYFAAIPPESYALAGNLKEFGDAVTDSLRWMDLGLLAIVVLEGFWAYSRPRHTSGNGKRWVIYCIATAVMAAVCAISMAAKGGFHKAYSDLVSACYTTTSGVPTYTVLGHIIFSNTESARATSPEMLARVDNWLEAQQRLYPTHTLPDSVAPRRNLVLILLESFETWPIGKTIDGKEITPNINRLIADSTTLYAPNVLTQVDAGRSSDAQLMLTTGLMTMENSVFATRFPNTLVMSLPKAMKEDRGARSAILSVDQKVTWNYAVVAETYGYDTVLERSDWQHDQIIKQHLSDGSFFRQSAEKMRAGLWPEGTPAMMTLIAYSGHAPFLIPQELRDADFDLSAAGLNSKLENYLQAIHYTDAQLPIIIDYLRSRSDWDSTLVVITGDHEGLATWRDEIRASSSQAASLVDARQMTPLIILNSPIAGRYDAVMGQVDVYPTLLELMGLDRYAWRGVGQSIFDANKVPAAISSMTRQVEGDTISVDPERLQHWKQMRKISDGIIRADRLKTFFDKK